MAPPKAHTVTKESFNRYSGPALIDCLTFQLPHITIVLQVIRDHSRAKMKLQC